MKNKFIQALTALILPVGFIIFLIILNMAPMVPIDKYGFGSIFILSVAILFSYIYLKSTKKTFKEVGFTWEQKTPKRFLIGFLIGIGITILILFVVFQFSELKLVYNSGSNIGLVSFWLLAFLPLALMEEIIFRGQAFIKMNTEIGIWPAQILFAILFAWYHDFTGQTLLTQLTGPGIWALIYGIAAIWSKGLALPTGLHMAINVVLALVGQKDSRHSIWNIEYSTDVTSALQDQTESIGLITQIGILIIAIVLTEYYRRNTSKISSKLT